MVIYNGRVCENSFIDPDCIGKMELSDPPIGGDCDESGKRVAFCHDCGSGVKEVIDVIDNLCQSTYVRSISDNRLLSIHHAICTRLNLPWAKKWLEKQELLMKLRDCCHSRRDIIEFYSRKPYHENIDFLEKIITVF